MTSEMIFFGLVQFCVLLFSLSFHEFGHAWTALRCGDPTARNLGRVTLNPLAHADPIGTVLFPLLQIFARVPLIGWAKPVPYDRHNLRHPGRDDILIGIAGPGANLILAFLAAVLMRLSAVGAGAAEAGVGASLHEFGQVVLPRFLEINLLLALFNLLPVPPLDGSALVENLLPQPAGRAFRAFGARWGFVLVLALVYTGVARTFIGFGYRLVSPFFYGVAGQ